MDQSLLGRILALVASRPFQILRYFLGGVLVSLGYTATVVVCMEYFDWGNANASNLFSLLVWTPASYLVHKHFTFQKAETNPNASWRFAFATVIKLITSVVIVGLLTDVMGLHYLFPVLFNWVALPLATYLVLKHWVFEDPKIGRNH